MAGGVTILIRLRLNSSQPDNLGDHLGDIGWLFEVGQVSGAREDAMAAVR